VHGRRSLAEHAHPELHELHLVEAAVLVLVEHLDEVPRHAVVEAEPVRDDRDHLLRTQHAVAVLVQLLEARRDLLVPGPASTSHSAALITHLASVYCTEFGQRRLSVVQAP